MIEDLHPRSTLGFSTPFNREAEDIENYLGLVFQAKPSKVRIGFRNGLALPLHVLDGRDFLELASSFAIAVFERKALGVFVPAYNAYLYKSEDSFVARHENMHAAIDQRNPSIHRLDEAMMRGNRGSLMSGDLTALPTNFETGAVYKCFQEGTAQWAAVNIGLRTGDNADRETATKYHNKMMNDKENTDRLTTSSQHGRRSVKKVHDAVTQIKGAFTKLDRDFPARLRNGKPTVQFMMAFTKTYLGISPLRTAINEASYHAGYFFSHFAMREMESRGVSIPEALVVLIDNPPTLVSQLQNPVGYAKSLVRQRS